MLLAIAVSFNATNTHGDETESATTDNAQAEQVQQAEQADIAASIIQLGNDEFTKREQAETKLIKLGEPALKLLHEAAKSNKDPEIRMRAERAIKRIDPNGRYSSPGIRPKPGPDPFRPNIVPPARPRIVPVPRVQPKFPFEARKQVDVTRWGRDIANPFTNLKKEGIKKLKAKGIDVAKLTKCNAVLLTGSWCGANSKTFYNHDENTVLVLGKGFITHGEVISKGPVLAIEDAHIMGTLRGEGLVWFAEQSFPRSRTSGKPLLVGPNARKSHDKAVIAAMIQDDFGWQRPNNFLKLPGAEAKGENAKAKKENKLAIDDADKKKKQLVEYIKAIEGVDVTQACKPIANPFAKLDDKASARLAARGIDPKRLGKLKARFLTGRYFGANSCNFVNTDPNTVLVVGKGFGSHGGVFSLGPIIAVDDAHFMGNVIGADVVWFVDESFPRGITTGMPVILAESAKHSQMTIAMADVWWGDYGFRKSTVDTKKNAKE